ncbi:hypothetical protein EW145_g5994 [Phellinidium pouzarii]|uniref:Nucleolus and neural progenitor protein-like N-terminal domain-containing protein n=1 Tax=Phellinidium pouzarii TaxID=167371 RepID=A0A4S4KY43_9AGAM|nr:hypothetical protein EW145_g5994 [Phellinidium pouzarii]
MPAARYTRRPTLSSTPRHSVSASHHPKFDAILKGLRACARQFSLLLPCLHDELRILERLYYKGLNQHRTALFWRRIKEARRLGQRLLETQLLALTDDLRYAFYVEDRNERNPKILRSVWSQVPDSKFVNYIFERTRSSMELTTESRIRFANAYHSLSLMMQTGAFLQLILTLTAIISRLDALVAELSVALETLSNSLSALLEALGEKAAKTIQQRCDPGPSHRVPRFEGTSLLGKSLWQQGEEPFDADAETVYMAPSLIISTAVARHTPRLVPAAAVSKRSREQTQEVKKSRMKVKKKKRNDEIDDIFGSM